MKKTDFCLSVEKALKFLTKTIENSNSMREDFPWFLMVNLETCFNSSDRNSFITELELIDSYEDLLTEYFEKKTEIKKIAAFQTKGLQHFMWRLKKPFLDYNDNDCLLMSLKRSRNIDYELREDRSWNQLIDVLASESEMRTGWSIYPL